MIVYPLLYINFSSPYHVLHQKPPMLMYQEALVTWQLHELKRFVACQIYEDSFNMPKFFIRLLGVVGISFLIMLILL
jgi:hypothetical protein